MLRAKALEDAAQFQTAIALKRQQVPVAGKLAGLTKTLPARVWVTQLSGNQGGRSVTLQGACLIDPDAPYEVPIKKWMAALKADPQFGSGLRSLNLESSSRKAQGKAQLLVFELSAEWGS